MITNSRVPDGNEGVNTAYNDNATYNDDTLGENTGDSGLEHAGDKKEESKSETTAPVIETVVPDNDN